MKKIRLTLLSILVVLILAACGATESDDNAGGEEGSAKDPLKVTLPTWTGYGPLFLAQEKGFFEKNGIEVELSIIEGLAERKQALAGGQVDGMATSLDTQITMAAADVPMEVVWLLDDSYGGDGIIAQSDINSVADLKGKQVAFEHGSTSHLFLLTALEQAGLTDQDVEMVQMSAGDAGAAFVAGQVDAAVTWEPWLSKATEANGKILVSSKELPGIIVDTVGFRKSVVEERPEDIQAFVNALAEAMDYWKENEEESNQIMAEGLNIDVEEFTATVTGLKFMDAQANKELFGTNEQQGDIYSSAQNASDFYLEKGLIETAPSADEVLNSTFVEGL